MWEQLLSGSKAVGLFTAASFVAQVPISFLAGGIGPSAYTLAVRAFEFTDHATVKAQLEENLVSLLGIVLPAAVGITALSRNLAYVLVGGNFAQAVIELAPWLCAAEGGPGHDEPGDAEEQERAMTAGLGISWKERLPAWLLSLPLSVASTPRPM